MISPRLSLAPPSLSAALAVSKAPRWTSTRAPITKVTNRGNNRAGHGLIVAAAASGSDDGDDENDDAAATTTSTSAPDPAAVAAAASFVVDDFLRSGDVVAVGPGELPAAVLVEIARRLERGTLERVRVAAAGDAPAAEAAVAGVPQVQLPSLKQLRRSRGIGERAEGRQEGREDAAVLPDVAVVQADEVDRRDLSFITCRHDDGDGAPPSTGGGSRGSGALPQPQLTRVAAAVSSARRGTVALASSPLAVVGRLTGDVPVAVALEGGSGSPSSRGAGGVDDVEVDWEEAAEALDDEFLGDASLGVWRRPTSSGVARTHPRGGERPHEDFAEGVTLLDVRFGDDGEPLSLLGDAEAPYADVAAAIEGVDGVVACGLVVGGGRGQKGRVAAVVVVGGGDADGSKPEVLRAE